MAASIITLPLRSNALSYDDDAVQDVLDLLATVKRGEGVAVDEAQDTEAKGRSRARAMATAIVATDEAYTGLLKTHSVETADGFVPAVSLKASAHAPAS